jgi:hypothetical protein
MDSYQLSDLIRSVIPVGAFEPQVLRWSGVPFLQTHSSLGSS